IQREVSRVFRGDTARVNEQATITAGYRWEGTGYKVCRDCKRVLGHEGQNGRRALETVSFPGGENLPGRGNGPQPVRSSSLESFSMQVWGDASEAIDLEENFGRAGNCGARRS